MAKKVGIVGLIILLLVFAVPLGIAAAMDGCPMCPAGEMPPMLTLCIGLIATIAMSFAFVTSRVFPMLRDRDRTLLFARSLERPPRFN